MKIQINKEKASPEVLEIYDSLNVATEEAKAALTAVRNIKTVKYIKSEERLVQKKTSKIIQKAIGNSTKLVSKRIEISDEEEYNVARKSAWAKYDTANEKKKEIELKLYEVGENCIHIVQDPHKQIIDDFINKLINDLKNIKTENYTKKEIIWMEKPTNNLIQNYIGGNKTKSVTKEINVFDDSNYNFYLEKIWEEYDELESKLNVVEENLAQVTQNYTLKEEHPKNIDNTSFESHSNNFSPQSLKEASKSVIKCNVFPITSTDEQEDFESIDYADYKNDNADNLQSLVNMDETSENHAMSNDLQTFSEIGQYLLGHSD